MGWRPASASGYAPAAVPRESQELRFMDVGLTWLNTGARADRAADTPLTGRPSAERRRAVAAQGRTSIRQELPRSGSARG
jgi:hypothetical protein